MPDSLERRTLLALAGFAGAGLPVLARSAADPAAVSRNRQSSHVMRKQALEISKDNAVFGVNHASFEKFGYSPAIRAAGLLFIAGQVGIRPDGSVPESVGEQTEWAFRRTGEILRLEGLVMADLVEVVSYHVDMASNLAEFLAVKERYTERPFPAWSIIGIDALTRPSLKIEIRSIAALRG